MSASSVDVSDPAVVVDGDAIRVLTLNRPSTLNAIDDELQRGVLSALRATADDENVRAVVLTGAGRAFSAGGDVDLIRAMQGDHNLRQQVLDRARDIFEVLTSLEVPVVTALNGHAVGAGCTLALMGDIVVMAEDAYLADPHVTIGLVPGDGGMVLWPLLAGLAAARAYLLTGDRMPALEAHRLGIVHRLAPRSDVLRVATELADRIAARPAFAVRETKRCLNLQVARAAEVILDAGMDAEQQSFDTAEHIAAMDSVDLRRASPRP